MNLRLPSNTIFNLLFGLAASVMVSLPLMAQTISVESSSLNNGDVNVPAVTDISVTFSDPLAFVGLPDLDLGGLPIEIELLEEECGTGPVLMFFIPDGCPEGWRLENDDKTLVLENVALVEDAVHTMVVMFAVSTEGGLLEIPYVVRFSTNSEIPQGSVSGKVTSDDVDVTGSLVALIGTNVVELIAGIDSIAIDPQLAFADEDGDYTASYIPDGEYYAMGVQIELDVLSELLEPAGKTALEGVAVGVHAPSVAPIASPVEVVGGGSVSGIDIELTSTGATAKDMADAVSSQITSEAPTAKLSLAAGAPMAVDGNSLIWMFIFTDLNSGMGWLSASIGNAAFPASRVDEQEDFGEIVALLATSAFTDYANSDQAVQWFLQSGGQAFIDEHPDAIGAGILLDRMLFDLIMMIIEGGDLGLLGPSFEVWTQVFENEAAVEAIEGVLSKTQALEAWIVAFIGLGEDLAMHMVAMGDDGTPLLVMGSSPAASNTTNASLAAAAWDPGAKLVEVTSFDLPVSSTGDAVMWTYAYYSASRDSILVMMGSGGEIGMTLALSVLENDGSASTNELISNWIDSPQAITAANEIAADFIASHLAVSATAVLTKGLQPSFPDRAIWRIVYTGTAEDGSLEEKIVDINAADGVYVEVEATGVQPTTFRLEQNYPNPFNPETVIGFLVNENGHVKLAIYNTLGQQVRSLVNGVRSEGAYRVRWDARDDSGNLLPSGVYLYRLEVDGSVETRQMTLLR